MNLLRNLRKRNRIVPVQISKKSPKKSPRNTPNSIRNSPRNTPKSLRNTPKKSPVKSPKQIKRRARQCTYCGNNLLSPLLEANGGDCIIGTNYQCLKKGIGYGIHSPIDLDFINYEPIDPPENIYCGDKRPLPDEYERFGRRSSCLRKGVGIGKKIKIQREGLNG